MANGSIGASAANSSRDHPVARSRNPCLPRQTRQERCPRTPHRDPPHRGPTRAARNPAPTSAAHEGSAQGAPPAQEDFAAPPARFATSTYSATLSAMRPPPEQRPRPTPTCEGRAALRRALKPSVTKQAAHLLKSPRQTPRCLTSRFQEAARRPRPCRLHRPQRSRSSPASSATGTRSTRPALHSTSRDHHRSSTHPQTRQARPLPGRVSPGIRCAPAASPRTLKNSNRPAANGMTGSCFTNSATRNLASAPPLATLRHPRQTPCAPSNAPHHTPAPDRSRAGQLESQ